MTSYNGLLFVFVHKFEYDTILSPTVSKTGISFTASDNDQQSLLQKQIWLASLNNVVLVVLFHYIASSY